MSSCSTRKVVETKWSSFFHKLFLMVFNGYIILRTTIGGIERIFETKFS